MPKYLSVAKNDLTHIPTPAPTKTWQPVAHSLVVETVDNYLEEKGIAVRNENITVNGKGDKFFASYALDLTTHGARLQLGFRNSTNKRFALGFVGGTNVIVCSNMQFAGDFVELRKHTAGLTLENLRAFVQSAIDQVREQAQAQRVWQMALSDCDMDDARLKCFAYDCMAEGAFQPRQFNDYRDSLAEEIKISDGVTLYQAHGAVTRMHRQAPQHHLPAISKSLTDVCDKYQYWWNGR